MMVVYLCVIIGIAAVWNILRSLLPQENHKFILITNGLINHGSEIGEGDRFANTK